METKTKLFLFYVLIILNIAGVLAGAWYYYGQMLATQPHLVLFVPDCPLYVLLFLFISLGLVKNDFLSFLVAVGMAKYGLWTVFVLIFHWQYYSLPQLLPITLLFIAGHLGMALEGLAIIPKKRISALALCAIICWFLINDYVDYAIGTSPLIPRSGMATVAALTVAASVLLPLALFSYEKKILQWRLVSFLRSLLE